MIYSALKTRVQGKIINIHNEIGSVSALTNQIAYLEKSKLKCVDSVIGKSNLKFERTCNGLAVFWPTMDLAEI